MSAVPDRRARDLLEQADASLLDLVDHVLNQGIVLSGDVILGLANVDLVYLRLSALLCAADRVDDGARLARASDRSERRRR